MLGGFNGAYIASLQAASCGHPGGAGLDAPVDAPSRPMLGTPGLSC